MDFVRQTDFYKLRKGMKSKPEQFKDIYLLQMYLNWKEKKVSLALFELRC